MKLKELIENNEFDINCHYLVYDCTEENDWHTAPVAYDNWGKDTIEPELLEKSIKYITVGDNRAIVIEVKGGKPLANGKFVVEVVYDPTKHKLRAVANDGIHGELYCQFPSELRRREGDRFTVGHLEYREMPNGSEVYITRSPYEPLD